MARALAARESKVHFIAGFPRARWNRAGVVGAAICLAGGTTRSFPEQHGYLCAAVRIIYFNYHLVLDVDTQPGTFVDLQAVIMRLPFIMFHATPFEIQITLDFDTDRLNDKEILRLNEAKVKDKHYICRFLSPTQGADFAPGTLLND